MLTNKRCEICGTRGVEEMRTPHGVVYACKVCDAHGQGVVRSHKVEPDWPAARATPGMLNLQPKENKQ